MLTALCKTAFSCTLYAAGRQQLAGALRRASLPETTTLLGKVGTVSFLHTEKAPEHHVPWSSHIARMDEIHQENSQRMFELGYEMGQLIAQNEQLLRELIYTRAEIDGRGALEIIARTEEVKIPLRSKSQERRGVQQVLAWMVANDKRLQKCMERICKQHKSDEMRISSILQQSLYATACEALPGTSDARLAMCEQHPWSPDSAAAVCILFETYKLDYQYRARNGTVIPSPYS